MRLCIASAHMAQMAGEAGNPKGGLTAPELYDRRADILPYRIGGETDLPRQDVTAPD